MLALLVNTVSTILVYSVVLMLGFWCWFQWTQWEFLQAARRMPCTAQPLPFIGHTHHLLESWEGITGRLLTLSKEAVTKGLYNVVFWCGPLPLILIHKLEDIQKVLTSSSTTEKGDEMLYLKWAFGENNLLTAPGHISKVTRRHIGPLFHPRNIEQLMPMFNSNSRELTLELSAYVDAKPLDVLEPAMKIAFKTVCQLVFGTEVEFDTKTEEFHGLIKVVEKIPELFCLRLAKPWLKIDSIFEFLYKKELKEMAEMWKRFTETPLKISKSNFANKVTSEAQSMFVEDDKLSCQGPLTLIDVYEELQKKHPQFTEKDLKDEMVTLYCAGSDTAGLTISSCLLLLGKHNDSQDRVYEEISSVVGPYDDVTIDHISRMPYLDKVFKETLRWAIIIPYIIRKTAEDLKLSTCTIPAGNTVVVGLIGPLIDPAIYPDPRKFDPERFSPENSAARDRHAYLPFSSGSRMCIGKTYSEHLVKTILIHILRKYKFSTDMDIHNLKKNFMVTLVNSEGYNVKIQHRK